MKLVIAEDGSDVAARRWDGCDGALTSRLADPEVRAALAAAGRNHDLDAEELAVALESWAHTPKDSRWYRRFCPADLT